MNGYHVHSQHKGISLIEALIAVIVLAVGLLAIAKFQGGLLSGSGLSKARAEAVQLAQDKLEELRNLSSITQYTNLGGGTDTINGVNATFTRTWTVTDQTNPDRKDIQVAIAWTDAKEGGQGVSLSGIVSWDDPQLSANLAAGEIPGGGFVAPPTGGARLGNDSDPSYTPGAVPGTPNTNPDGSFDGTSTYAHDGVVELIDTASGKVKLVLTNGDAFSTVSGKVYIKGTSPAASLVYVLTSNAGYCSRTIASPVDQLPEAPDPVVYTLFMYKCYVGPHWYGNIGIAPGLSNEVCLGDPSFPSTDATSTSRRPVLNSSRMYRGYVQQYDSGGAPLLDADGDPIYVSQGIEEDSHYSGHHFLLTTITGNPAVAPEYSSPCKTNLELYNSPNPFVGLAAGNDNEGNPGWFFCLTASCPSPLPMDLGPPVQSTPRYITGEILGGFDLSNTAVTTSDGDSCPIAGTTYTCTVYDLGSGWTGTVGIASDYGVCSANPLSFVQLVADSGGNNFTLCDTAMTTTIAGAVSKYGNPTPSFSGVTITGGTCTSDASSYSCTTAEYTGTWSGTITVSTTKTLCPDAITDPTQGVINSSAKTITFSGVATSAITRNFAIAKNSGSCP